MLCVSVLAGVLALAAPTFDHGHTAWTGVLKGYVNDGRVAYTALKDGPGERELDAYLALLRDVTPAQYAAFSSREKLAYWINAYNAFTVKRLLMGWPVDSIRQIGLLPGAAFRDRFIAVKLEGREDWSLQDVEETVMERFKEPRALLALSCGARGCPMLRATAYRADALDSQLDDAAQRFIGDLGRNRVDVGRRTVEVSEFFRRHPRAFETPTLLMFMAPYLDTDAYDAIKHQGASLKVAYAPLDWQLNGY
jgi:hypothetical protein